MIQTTVNSLIAIKTVLQQLANTEMPARDGFTVLRLLKKVDKEYESIEEVQHKMLETYGDKDPETGNYKLDGQGGVLIKQESTAAFAEEMGQFLNTEVKIEAAKLKLDLLEQLQLTPNQLLKLEDFIEE